MPDNATLCKRKYIETLMDEFKKKSEVLAKKMVREGAKPKTSAQTAKALTPQVQNFGGSKKKKAVGGKKNKKGQTQADDETNKAEEI